MKVQLIESMANDLNVVQAAKVSTLGAETLNTQTSEGLINFLIREKHGSPTEHSVFKFFIQAPIFVAREFMRHRMLSLNEESGRYRELSPEFYFPENPDRPLIQIGKASEYKFEETTNPELREQTLDTIGESYVVAWEAYTSMLKSGVAKEIARIVLPLGIYTSWFTTINARSLMNFLSLRTAPNAQWEIQQIANEMEESFKTLMPITHKAWVDNGRKAV
jgi:thymidylate synthase (FAD)